MNQYYKKAIKSLKKSGFIEGNVDSCLYVKKRSKDIGYIALYVDIILMIGDIKAIYNVRSDLKNIGLVLNVMEGLHVLHHYIFIRKKRAMLGQLHLIKNMDKKFV